MPHPVVNRRNCLTSIVIVVLFVYAYLTYKKKANMKNDDEEEDGEKEGFLQKLRNKGNREKKKVSFSEPATEPNKEKIYKLVQEILLKQMPQ